MRLLTIIGLGLTLTVTSACQNDGKRRMPLKRGSQAQAGVSERSKALNELLGTGKCLRIDKLIKGIMAKPQETILLYTSDISAIEQNDEPVLEAMAAKDLLTASSKSFLFAFTDIDEKCSTVTLTNFGNFKIVDTKLKGQLLLENAADSTHKIAYNYDRRDKLTITHFVPTVTNACGKGTGIAKRTYVLTRGEGLNNLEISRSMAALFERHITLPAEISAAFVANTRTSDKIILSYPGYAMIKKALASESVKRPLCPNNG